MEAQGGIKSKNNVQNFRRLLLAIDLKWNHCGKWVWKLLFAVWFICPSGSWKLCNFEQTDIKHIGEACSSWMHTTLQTRTSHFSNNSPTQEHQPHVSWIPSSTLNIMYLSKCWPFHLCIPSATIRRNRQNKYEFPFAFKRSSLNS